ERVKMWTSGEDLPEPVAKEVKGFFKMCQDKLIAEGLSPSKAAEVLSTITGALVVAMPPATLPNMTEQPAICCVSARQLQLIVTARADQERSALRRWPRVIDEAAGRRGTPISV